MQISGLQKVTLIDFPCKVACTIFTQGCNFRCGYCHNPELAAAKSKRRRSITEKEIFEYLEKRKGKLEGVVITGGEPTLQPDLLEFIKKIKVLGYLVKLDTNGSNPELLKKLVKQKLVDYVAMDIKGTLNRYKEITNSKADKKDIKKSIRFLLQRHVDYEFRTTIVRGQLRLEDFEEIGKLIKGARFYYLQKFVASKCVDKSFLNKKSYSEHYLRKIRKTCLKYVRECFIR